MLKLGRYQWADRHADDATGPRKSWPTTATTTCFFVSACKIMVLFNSSGMSISGAGRMNMPLEVSKRGRLRSRYYDLHYLLQAS